MGTLPIAVVIPSWGPGYRDLLPRAIASAADVSCRVVVGDENARGPALAAGAERFIQIGRKHPGPAREQGIDGTTEPFLLFLDSDDYLLPGAVHRLYARLEAEPKAVAAAGLLVRDPGGTTWPRRRRARAATGWLGAALLLQENAYPAADAVLIRRSGICGRPLFPELDDEDWHAAMRLRVSGRLLFDAFPAAMYRSVPGSVSRSRRDRTLVMASRRALLPTAEHAAGRPLPLLRLADLMVRRRRTVRVDEVISTWGTTEQ